MRIILASLSTILFVACGSANHSIDGSNPKAGVAESDGFDEVKLGTELVRYARQQKSLPAYLTALQVLGANPTRDLGVQKSESGGKDGPQKADKEPITVEGVAAEARALANGDATAIAQIDALARGTSKGAVGGARQAVERVRAYASDTFVVDFRGGRTAEVLVSGDGDTDLDLFIYDENGNLICSDEDSTDECYCRWNPAWTGPFEIRVKNFGDVYNRYVLLTN